MALHIIAYVFAPHYKKTNVFYVQSAFFAFDIRTRRCLLVCRPACRQQGRAVPHSSALHTPGLLSWQWATWQQRRLEFWVQVAELAASSDRTSTACRSWPALHHRMRTWLQYPAPSRRIWQWGRLWPGRRPPPRAAAGDFQADLLGMVSRCCAEQPLVRGDPLPDGRRWSMVDGYQCTPYTQPRPIRLNQPMVGQTQ